MDKSWMRFPHKAEYVEGIKDFIACASQHLDKKGRTRCPCNKCKNKVYKHIDEVNNHLFDYGIVKDYTHWVYHGEPFEVLTDDEDEDGDNISLDGRYDGLDELLEDIEASTHGDNILPNMQHAESINEAMEQETFTGFPTMGEGGTKSFEKLVSEASQPLYPGCVKFTKLDFLVKLLHLKVINRWSNKSFTMVLQLIKAAFPMIGESFPKSYYEAKSLMRNLGLGYITIDACKYDCAIFYKEYEHHQFCPVCGEPRYKIDEGKGRKIPHKILRYFPLKPRLQRLFMSRMTADDMRWHEEKRANEENVLRHPADSKAWQEFDKENEWFASDPRNVRLGLASDGFNPFGDLSNSYSMWPVMLIPYNLPPWKCMKEPFIFMSLLIPGPKAPGNDIDVYLRPLIDELLELWEEGVETYDSMTKQTFQMHAALLWTINDFPAYGNLSGWCTKGKLACPNCNKNTCTMYLKNYMKLCYMNHGRLLPPRHSLRKRLRQVYGDNNVSGSKPLELSVEELLDQLECVNQQDFGKNPKFKKRKRPEHELNWTKKSIFFELPYWRTLKLRHNLDVMHIEKNICENVLGTLLDMDGKTKDTVKTRLDLKLWGIRPELHLVPNGDKYVVPAACYTLSKKDRSKFCEWLKTVKYPDGYASNISRCVNTKDGKVSGMKSHDCHVFLQRILPVALRGFFAKDVSSLLIELGFFFRELCCKTLRLEMLENMEKDIVVILSKLELIFPPSFFDVIVHLAVHLPREAILGGPVQYRWMYPIERFLHTLKQYVRNKARPEGSIAEAYIDTECLTFCSMYLQGIETRFNRKERNYDGDRGNQSTELFVFSQNVRTMGAPKSIKLSLKEFDKAHYYVLNNSEEIASYIDEHTLELEKDGYYNLEERREKTFPAWFKKHMQELHYEKNPKATNELYSLACGPGRRVTRYSACIVNGIRFHTKDREANLRTQNSGVVVKGDHQSQETDFYGALTDIIELEYMGQKRVYLFKCDWWDVGNKRSGIQIDNHFTSVNVSKKWYVEDQFVLATQASQVFYVGDTKLGGSWQVVQKITPRNVYDVLVKEVGKEPVDEAYQQEEQLATNVIENEEVTLQQLSREDENPIEVDAALVNPNMIESQQVDGVFIVEDEDDEGEDNTLMDYCSEEEAMSTDNETDMDEE